MNPHNDLVAFPEEYDTSGMNLGGLDHTIGHAGETRRTVQRHRDPTCTQLLKLKCYKY